ncbi:MAG: hypothetical protein ICV83_14405 [Cytophagales bacterium]|nr:hypothetical protein [Cytophagales bacterium]
MPALPETAVVHYEGKAYVFVDAGNYRFRRVAVATGVRQGEMVEVRSEGLPATSGQVVVKRAHTCWPCRSGRRTRSKCHLRKGMVQELDRLLGQLDLTLQAVER